MAATTTTKKKIPFAAEIKDTVEHEPEQKKPGRPATAGDTKKISLAIPVDLMNGIEAAAGLLYNGNKTAYINALIKKDLAENLEKYQEFQAMKARL